MKPWPPIWIGSRLTCGISTTSAVVWKITSRKPSVGFPSTVFRPEALPLTKLTCSSSYWPTTFMIASSATAVNRFIKDIRLPDIVESSSTVRNHHPAQPTGDSQTGKRLPEPLYAATNGNKSGCARMTSSKNEHENGLPLRIGGGRYIHNSASRLIGLGIPLYILVVI
jgi:hypothetical protein